MARLPTQSIYEAYRLGNNNNSSSEPTASTTTAAPDLLQVHNGPITAYSILEREPVATFLLTVHVGSHRRIAELRQQEHNAAEDLHRQDVGADNGGGNLNDWQDVGVQTSFLARGSQVEEEGEEAPEEGGETMDKDANDRKGQIIFFSLDYQILTNFFPFYHRYRTIPW